MARQRSPIVATGKVEGGKFRPDSPKVTLAALHTWEGDRAVMTLEPEQITRSGRAHRYLFGVVYKLSIPALVDAGYQKYTPMELHTLMKERHNKIDLVDPFTGEVKQIGGSTKQLSVQDFGVFIENVMCDMATLAGVSFPEPRTHEDWRDGKAAA
jgi:hypothetical protein